MAASRATKPLALRPRPTASRKGSEKHEKRDLVTEEQQAYIAERQEINRQKREMKQSRKAARKAKLAAAGHWSSTKSGRKAFWAEKLKNG